jgi:hypothetical protein
MAFLRSPVSVLAIFSVAACACSSNPRQGTGGGSGTMASSGGPTGSGAASSSASSGTGGASPMGLHAVMGSSGHLGHLADGNGKMVILRGVDESGSENYCFTWGPPRVVLSPPGGPSPLDQSSVTAMKSWGINAVRIPLNEDCWLGINGVDPSVGAANYQAPIKQAVDLVTQTNGMYVILDLHLAAPGTMQPSQVAMPDVDHSITFWQQVASAYKDNGSVVFDLYNEPVFPSSSTDDQSFSCWKNGSTSPNGGDCPMVNYAVAGMQTLVSTVRQAGANNLLILGGTGYASRLGLWPKYVPTDTLSPPNIAASWHVYDDQGGCTSDPATSLGILCPATAMTNGAAAVMAAGYPIVVGETGYYSCSGSVGSTWWPIFLSWAETQQMSYVAWSWSNGNKPQLLQDTTSYTPNANGKIYKNFLACITSKTVAPAASCTSIPSTGCE